MPTAKDGGNIQVHEMTEINGMKFPEIPHNLLEFSEVIEKI